jgi:predicted AAA+ superfamily ATPase
VADSLIEPVLSRDVLQMQVVHKPALLRHLFLFAASLPAQCISYTKIMGQLQDAGNTTTLAHYLSLLETAFLVSGLMPYSERAWRQRGGSPKLVLWNNALVSSLAAVSPAVAGSDPAWRGRLVENAVGAHLLNALPAPVWGVHYWRQGDHEVDYVVTHGRSTWAVEVKSGRGSRLSGMAAFRKQHPKARALLVGSGGLPLEEFFAAEASEFFQE